MSTLDRMIAERDRLQSEADKLTEAICLINKFKETTTGSHKKPEKIRIRKKQPRNGLAKVVKKAVWNAIYKHNRPVTLEEIMDEVLAKGFTKQDVENGRLSKLIYPDFCGEGGGKPITTMWFKNKPRPEYGTWKDDLGGMKCVTI